MDKSIDLIIVDGKFLKFNHFNTSQLSFNKIIYEVFRVSDNIALFIDDHLNRLINGLNKSSINYSFNIDSLKHDIKQLIANEEIGNGNIKINCYCNSFEVCSYTIHFIPSYYPTKEQYSKGVIVNLFDAERNNPEIKEANTNVRNQANIKINNTGVYETLLVNHDNLILEGSRTNVFFIKNETIYTSPDELVLHGIMRSKVINIINELNLNIEFSSISAIQLNDVKAAFLTGTSPQILPIRKINNFNLNVNSPLLRKLMKQLSLKIDDYKNEY